jgi:hypothetical protein
LDKVGTVAADPAESDCSGIVVKFAQRNSHLPGKIDQRYAKGAKGHYEEDGNPALVLDLKERAYKGNDHHEGYGDTADYGPEDSPVDHGRAPKQTWNVCLEPKSDGIVINDRVQDDRSIDDPVEA